MLDRRTSWTSPATRGCACSHEATEWPRGLVRSSRRERTHSLAGAGCRSSTGSGAAAAVPEPVKRRSHPSRPVRAGAAALASPCRPPRIRRDRLHLAFEDRQNDHGPRPARPVGTENASGRKDGSSGREDDGAHTKSRRRAAHGAGAAGRRAPGRGGTGSRPAAHGIETGDHQASNSARRLADRAAGSAGLRHTASISLPVPPACRTAG